MANAILNSGAEYDQGKMLYNKYKSVVSYDTTAIPIFSQGMRMTVCADSFLSFSSYFRDCDGG